MDGEISKEEFKEANSTFRDKICEIEESGYLLDATRPKLLWFYKFCKRNRLNLNCLLRQSIEQFAA
jgi:hypothetical protein